MLPVPDRRSAILTAAGVLAVTLLALALRSVGIAHLLPCFAEPDLHLVVQAERLRAGQDDVPRKYPLLIARAVALLPAEEPPPPAREEGIAPHLERASRPILELRRVVALLASLIVPATYFLARRLLPRGWSLLAAAFMALDLLHLDFSQQARPHAVLATFTTIAVLWCCRLARSRGALVDLIGAGVTAGVALSCLHSGFLVLAPLAVAAGFVLKDRGLAALPRLLVPLAIAGALAGWSYAPTLAPRAREAATSEGAEGPSPPRSDRPARPPRPDPGGERSDSEASVLRVSGHRIYLGAFNGSGFRVLAEALRGHAPATLTILGAGLLAAIMRRVLRRRSPRAASPPGRTVGRDGVVLAAFVVPAAAVFGLYELSNPRFFLPLLPFLALCAAAAVREIARLVAPRGPRNGLVTALLVVLALAVPFVTAARLAWLRTAEDTLSSAAAFITAEVDRFSEVLVVDLPSLPLVQRIESLRRADAWSRTPWERHQFTSKDLRAVARWESYRLHYPGLDRRRLVGTRSKWGFEWLTKALAEDQPAFVVFAADAEGSWTRRVRGAFAAAGGTLRARFPSGEGTTSLASPYSLGESAAFDVLTARALGPPIEIWGFEP